RTRAMPASTSQRRTKPKVRRNSDVIFAIDSVTKLDLKIIVRAERKVFYGIDFDGGGYQYDTGSFGTLA
ncbi:hypothetical protein PL960_09435, partial [Bifidobacterium adolescentis]|uniref:hypothetical protein n=1 Tax=Bifidobacterium adolescentis TaxID=1680 RepID=UPI002A32EC0C|nr:hypothetical protein [Bifidobacterium adolescentis]MDB1502496.1 hypothetical protein [Bifidobacterium adolescentis]